MVRHIIYRSVAYVSWSKAAITLLLPLLFTEFRGARKCLPSLPQSSLDRGGGSASAAAAPMSGGRTIKFMVWALGPPRSVGRTVAR